MFVVFLLFFIFVAVAYALFILLNLVAAGAVILGLLTLLAMVTWRKNSFWTLLIAMPLFLGGLGALGGAWAGYYAMMHYWPESNWPIFSWMSGYVLGGAFGAMVGFFTVLQQRSHELSQIQSVAKAHYRFFKNQLATANFRQTLRIGAWQLRVAIFKTEPLH